ncbi:MAG TPA: MerR family transcriptional regulator [Sedimentisphaerales bacterium]|nr:MerR family transcriptional regulator [Sedimentisphaerales bacterium]
MQSEIKVNTLKIPDKLYRIGELVRYTPFSRQTIHNYTSMGLIREAQWTEGGHRLYDESVFQRLARIIELKKTKTLWEVRKILRQEEDAFSPARPPRSITQELTAGIPKTTD